MICDKCRAAGYKRCIEAARDDIQGREPDELSRLRAENERVRELLGEAWRYVGELVQRYQSIPMDINMRRAKTMNRTIGAFLCGQAPVEEVRWNSGVHKMVCYEHAFDLNCGCETPGLAEEVDRTLPAAWIGSEVEVIVRRKK